jgi:hypothetical protein
MRVWRLLREEFAANPLSGLGAALAGGRLEFPWRKQGAPTYGNGLATASPLPKTGAAPRLRTP